MLPALVTPDVTFPSLCRTSLRIARGKKRTLVNEYPDSILGKSVPQPLPPSPYPSYKYGRQVTSSKIKALDRDALLTTSSHFPLPLRHLLLRMTTVRRQSHHHHCHQHPHHYITELDIIASIHHLLPAKNRHKTQSTILSIGPTTRYSQPSSLKSPSALPPRWPQIRLGAGPEDGLTGCFLRHGSPWCIYYSWLPLPQLTLCRTMMYSQTSAIRHSPKVPLQNTWSSSRR